MRIETDRFDSYFAGDELYGDDFSTEEITAWAQDESEAYANLGAAQRGTYAYGYHAVNIYNGFRWLPKKEFSAVLGYGSAYGSEFEPIISRIKKLSIVDSSEAFVGNEVFGIPVTYSKPLPNGELDFPDDNFDLITCLGVLHHIPNVSAVLREFYRILKPGGIALIREPTVSMGDWRGFRPGLTKHERGIPLQIYRRMLGESGFEVVREARCMFSLLGRLRYLMRGPVYNSAAVARLDKILCWLFAWQRTYHAKNMLSKIGPTSIFSVVRKPAQ